jgi:hypothetical protein
MRSRQMWMKQDIEVGCFRPVWLSMVRVSELERRDAMVAWSSMSSLMSRGSWILLVSFY